MMHHKETYLGRTPTGLTTRPRQERILGKYRSMGIPCCSSSPTTGTRKEPLAGRVRTWTFSLPTSMG